MRWALSRVTGGVAAILALQVLAASGLAAQSTGTIRGRVVENETSRPISDVQVVVEGTSLGGTTNDAGEFTIAGVPPGNRSVSARRLGFERRSQSVAVPAGGTVVANFSLPKTVSQLDAVVVTALGETTEKRSLGTAQQSVRGAEIAETQRENFVNALQGRIAGVEVTSSSGTPGSSSNITIRGVSSISSSNQPLFIIDGLPLDNKTLNTGVLASQISGTGFENRGLDFTNRAADINPEDIESITVLKGPEAATLYGIDAANGAIVITTKRGRAGTGGFEYSNRFRVESVRARPEVQRVFGQSTPTSTSYFGDPYPTGTTFYDNIDGFFRTAMTQTHNLTFSGAAADNKLNYRVTGGMTQQEGVVPNDLLNKYNVTGSTQSQVKPWLNVDFITQYIYTENRQSFKGAGGPLLGLLIWPQTDNASDYLTPSGTRRTLSSSGEVDNPYFGVNKNRNETSNNRIIANLGLRFSPFSWGNLKTTLGTDTYTNAIEIVRHPESAWGSTNNGVIDVANDRSRSLTAQTVLNVNSHQITDDISISGLAGNSIWDSKSTVDALWGRDFLDPNFVSVNNALVRTSRTSIAQRRLIGLFAEATVDYKRWLFVNVAGRNDWTSTIPRARNSFFYPRVSTSFIFSDAFPAVGEFMTGKLRAAWAEAGKDAQPYAYQPALQAKNTAYGGYGYDFWGPNPNLRPEFATSYELGAELSFLDDRLGIEPTWYRKQTRDQIVQNIRGSYATGFILFNLNGAETRNEGLELTVRGTPVLGQNFTWDFVANYDRSRGTVVKLPADLPESYNSDTWLYGNIRNGTGPGLSTRSITGTFWMRNKNGDLLIDPATGLPVRSAGFVDAGYDRQPDFTVGLQNTLTYKRARLSFLWDIRRGGDIFNATEHYLTSRGLSMRTLDRRDPRVIQGVLRDGLENSDNPTPNNIVVIPEVNTGYYAAVSEELFIEKDINWLRLRDVTLNYRLPERFGTTSVFLTATDLLLFTNYSGLDPIVNGNSAAVGGSGGVGVDLGNFPIPRGLNFGLKTSF